MDKKLQLLGIFSGHSKISGWEDTEKGPGANVPGAQD